MFAGSCLGSLLVASARWTWPGELAASLAWHLLERTGLRDSRRGFGRQPTFATQRPVRGLWVAIDHVLVGPEIDVLARRTPPLPGSDHRAVVADLVLTGC